MPNPETKTNIYQLLSFTLGKESYAIDVMKIQGVERFTYITSIPKMPPFVEGVIDLRSKIVPVIDLRKRFNLPPKDPDKETRIIVTEIDKKQTGLIVDSVLEVFQTNQSEIEAIPTIDVQTIDTNFLIGLTRIKDKLVIIIDIEKILTPEEKGVLSHVSDNNLDILSRE